MRLVRVEVEILDVPFREPVISGTQRWEDHRAGILILRTDDGRKGLAEFPAPRPHDLGEDVSPRLIEVLTGIELSDPVTLEGTLRDIDAWPFVGRAARSAVESALIDVLARVSRQSIATYLDSQARPDVAVNAMLGIDPPEATAAQAKRLVDDGFRCLKLKAGEEPDGSLAARVEAVRAAVGQDVALRLDFNGSLKADWAEDVLASVARFDIEYAEQPVPPGAGAEALARLRWTGTVPIAADESVRDLGAARILLDTGAVDALVVKPARVGGLRQARAIIELAAAANVPVTVSTLFETGVGLAGAAHLAATAPGSQAHGLATAHLLASDLLLEPLAIRDGRLAVPERVRQDPDAVALRAPSATWTRAQLLDAADGLADALHGEGLGEGRHIACLLDDDAPAITLIHATRRLAAVHIPLNRRASATELRLQLERSNAHGLLCDGAHASKARAAAPDGVAVHRIEALLAAARCAAPPRLRERIEPGAHATIVYTSGTTGRPKGALLTHDNHRASAHAWAALLRPRPGDRWLLCVPLFHVAGLAIVTRATRWGATLEVHDRFDPTAVSAAIDDGVTHLSLVATQLVGLLAARADRPVPPTLRAILLGGGPMPAELLRRARATGYPVLTTYGLTETGSGVVSGGDDQATLDDPAAGRALPGVELRVAPDAEILVRGEMVFAGYVDDEAATARALPGDGWLHTGDHGTLDDRLLRIDARRDDLIISGGENIVPAEVEAVLEAHPGVVEAAVVGVADEHWGAVPRAFIVTSGPDSPDDEELAGFCRSRLAGFKVPTSFVRLEALPRNALGKVARSELAGTSRAGTS